MTFSLILWISAALGLITSAMCDRQKTGQACRKALKMLCNLLPMMIAVIVIIGITFAMIPPETLQRILGGYSAKAILISGILGSLSLIPMFIAAPLAGSLLQQGAGIAAIAMFITTLNMVGFLTAPLEKEFFGWRVTLMRNAAGFIAASVIALLIGAILS